MKSLIIYLPNLKGGGAERLHILLAPHLAKAFDVTFLLDRAEGELMAAVPQGCNVVSLDAARQISALPKLVRHLRRHQPYAIIANMEHMNVMALLARSLSGVPTRVIVTQHNSLSAQVARRSWKWRVLPALYRALLPRADAILAVSEGVARDLSVRAGIGPERVEVIYNGVVTDDFDERAAAEPAERWLLDGGPAIVGMGRLVAQKDFETMIRAFAAIADKTDAKLLIYGQGAMRGELEDLVRSLGLSDRIALPGFAANPLAVLRHARLFVLSSRFEGFGNVVAEALACGTPVVSTDCPYGPSEILEDGRFGRLTPVGDVPALSSAILAALSEQPDRASLKARGQTFSVRNCAARYREMLHGLDDRRRA